jgi:hypothetical protein
MTYLPWQGPCPLGKTWISVTLIARASTAKLTRRDSFYDSVLTIVVKLSHAWF